MHFKLFPSPLLVGCAASFLLILTSAAIAPQILPATTATPTPSPITTLTPSITPTPSFPATPTPPPTPVSYAEVIEVMTANLNSGVPPNSDWYRDASKNIFEGLDPDIVLIQEFNVEPGTTRDDFITDVFGADYYYYCEPEIGDTWAMPNGIISRWPINSSGQWSDSQPAVTNRSFVWAVIDIPGDIDLQVVSIHLKAGSSADDRQTREAEASQLKNYVEANFDDNQYIIIGGDLNLQHDGESPFSTFESYLDAADHRPRDRTDDMNTNSTGPPRTKPYDWIMPNELLDNHHTTIYIGSDFQAFPEGIVFDSEIFTPLDSVPPIEFDDSRQSGCTHMAVMKSYHINVHSSLVEEGFDDFQIGTRPNGWTFTNCNANSDTYTTPGNYGNALPSIKLDANNDSIITNTLSNPTALTFWIKGIGTDATSALLVEDHYNDSWYPLAKLINLPTSGTTMGPFNLYVGTDQIKFTYTQSLGNVAFDDVCILGITPPPITPTPSPPTTPTPSPVTTPTPSPIPPTTPTPSPIPPTTPSPVPPTTPTPSPIPPTTPTASPVPPTTPTPSPIPPTPTPVPPTPSPTPSTTPTPTPPPAPPPWIYDYNGDGISDIAIFRANAGLWAVRMLTRIYFGSSSDEPVPGDYDGDTTTDIGIFRRSTGLWAIRFVTRIYFGSSADQVIPGDYDGDGCCDAGIFRATSGLWAFRGVARVYFGGASDEPIPGYFDGGGTKNIGIFRPSSGLWAIRSISRLYFGGSGDKPVPGDYDGDKIWEVGIFRSASGLWAIRGVTRCYFGGAQDQPVPADYGGNYIDNIGIFRATSGLWAVKEFTRAYYGSSGDLR